MRWFSFQLLFTIVIWIFFMIVLFSNRRNRLNRWCFFTGMVFSLGVFKEYFYYDLAPVILSGNSTLLAVDCVEKLYSCMTSILYLCAMPAAFIFSLYFCGYPQYRPIHFRRILRLMPLPVLLFVICFPPLQTRGLQQTSLIFWIFSSLYNLFYGVLFTTSLFFGVIREHSRQVRRQKRLVAILVIPLIWYWLITIFAIHTLGLNAFFKLWQGNVLLFAVAMCFYVGMAFREGIMGIHLNPKHYEWESEAMVAFQGVQFISHTLNRDLTKLEWCAASLSERSPAEAPPELQIISQSVARLRGLAARTCLYSGELLLNPETCLIGELLLDCDIDAYQAKGINVIISCDLSGQIYCDRRHTTEILKNLLDNAADAIKPSGGIIQINLRKVKARRRNGRYDVLTVSDNGCGIPDDKVPTLFRPYQTEKTGTAHLGLGLFYCLRVMREQNGFIEVKSIMGKGSEFQLYFPVGRKQDEYCADSGLDC